MTPEHFEHAAPRGALAIAGHEVTVLSDGWQVAASAPGNIASPEGLGQAGLPWLQASVPGTAWGASRATGTCPASAVDERDWWFRRELTLHPPAAGERVVLELDGLATLAEIYLDGMKIGESRSMFESLAIDIGTMIGARSELVICCRALAPLLAEPHRPRARWRTQISANSLRFYRTTLLGRGRSFGVDAPPVGPWRPIRVRRLRSLEILDLRTRTAMDGGGESDRGHALVRASVRALGDGFSLRAAHIELSGPTGIHDAQLTVEPLAGGSEWLVAGELRVAGAARWWPHTHGEPALYELSLALEGDGHTVVARLGEHGFRTLAGGASGWHDAAQDGLRLHLNGTPIFARGAVWTPLDPINFSTSAAQLQDELQRVKDAGMNILRVPGFSVYEQRAFHALCDRLGILVWQDMMFARFDYPFSDPGFRSVVEHELRDRLEVLGAHPSTAVVCANSEVEQQVAMLGLDPELARADLYDGTLRALMHEASCDAVHVRSSPCGGTMPFRTATGVAQ
ncbi:MAG: glycosyl hydrolase 2 galactose-binding domain-containing protein, partial [Solirubrobacteraceae bacterium]